MIYNGGIIINEVFEFNGGMGDILLVYEDCIVIKHKGVLNAISMGVHGDKTIFYSDLTSIQFKEAGFLAGHIQFSLLGGRESTGGVLAASSDENTISFSSNHLNSLAEKVVSYIENKIRESKAAKNAPVQVQAAAPISIADELLKFKQLLDMGVISQEEFDNKKAELMCGSQSSQTTNTTATQNSQAISTQAQGTTFSLTIQQKAQFYLLPSDMMVSIDGGEKRQLSNAGNEYVVELPTGDHNVEFSCSFRKTAVIVSLKQNSKLLAAFDRLTGTIKVTPDENTDMVVSKKQ